jgi:hypothetical protein
VRNGKAALVLSEHLSKVTKAVTETGKRGRLSLFIDVIPTSVNSRGEVDEVKVDLTSKLTLPCAAPGAALFYPTASGTGLTQTDPDQELIFGSDDDKEGDKR